MPRISVIIPVLNEAENIPLLFGRLQGIANESACEFEYVFIDDGSTDASFSLLKAAAVQDPRFKVVRFSRNFGSHAACSAGLRYAKGDACVFISADLQDPPELILRLIAEWEKGFDVVIGVREWGPQERRTFQKVYYRLVRAFALRNMPSGGTDVFLIDRKVARVVVAIGEKNTSIFGLILWSGYDQQVITYRKAERVRGVSKWSLAKKVKLFVDTFISFSYFPLRTMSVLGIATAFAGFCYALIIIAARLFFEQAIEGWSSLMVVLLLVSGIQMVMLGVLGEYLWRNFDEARNRPSYIVRESVGADEQDPGTATTQ